MSSPGGFAQKAVSLDGRKFSLRVLKFANGRFVTVSEGDDRIGSMAVSMAAGPAPVTTTIIPSKSGSLFLKLAAEQVCARAGGIAMVSSFVRGDLGRETAKALMAEILDMVQND